MDGLFRTSLISLLVARRTLLVFPLEFGLWHSLTIVWFSRSPLFSQDRFVYCALAKAFALSAIIWLGVMWTSLLLIQPLYLQLHTYKDPSQDLVPNNLTIRYFRFLELFLTYMRI